MNEDAIRRARERIAAADHGRADPAALDAALVRARTQVEELARAAAELEGALPAQVAQAVREGVRAEALPVARQLAEVRGLTGQVIGRLERLEGDLLAERHARIDDLALLVELVASGWQSVDARLDRIEQQLGDGRGASVVRLDAHRDTA